jgi:hypothetical protein
MGNSGLIGDEETPGLFFSIAGQGVGRWASAGGLGGMVRRDCTNDPIRVTYCRELHLT